MVRPSLAACRALIILLCATGAESGSPRVLPFTRLNVDLMTRMSAIEFLVARSPAEFQSVWVLHAMPGVSGLRSTEISAQQPNVDFTKSIVIAFIGGNSPCEPYRITHIFEYSDRITAEITHPSVTGTTCVCAAVYAPSIEVVTMPRSDKPVDYVIKPERTHCGPHN
jgi:hypothetical protein